MIKLILVAVAFLTTACAQVVTPAHVMTEFADTARREAKRPAEFFQISCNSFYVRRANITFNGMYKVTITTSHPMRLFGVTEPSTVFFLSANNVVQRTIMLSCANFNIVTVKVQYND